MKKEDEVEYQKISLDVDKEKLLKFDVKCANLESDRSKEIRKFIDGFIKEGDTE